MSAEVNKALVREYLSQLNKDKSPALLDTYMTDESLKQHIAMYDTVLPGYRIEAKELVAEGDLVNVRGNVIAIHNGPFGEIPPTGKDVNIQLFITYRIANGKIAEHWMLVDMLAFLQQIGAIPVPAQT